MGYTQYFYYEDAEITPEAWYALGMFASRAAEEIAGTTCEVTPELIVIDAARSCENLVLARRPEDSERQHEAFAFCKTAQLPYDAVVVAVLIAAQQVDLIDKWRSDGDTEDTRPGVDLYYRVSDFIKEDTAAWWWEMQPPERVASRTARAAAFHAAWDDIKDEVECMAKAAEALASVDEPPKSLVYLLRDLNGLLMHRFKLAEAPISEDTDRVTSEGMLAVWRDTMFEVVVNG